MKPWPLLLLCAACAGPPFETGSEFEADPFALQGDAMHDAGSASTSSSTVTASATSSSSSATSKPEPSTSSSSSFTTTSSTSTVTIVTVTASSACGALFAQCGGSGWQGATCCQPGLACASGNYYFSQCTSSAPAGDP